MWPELESNQRHKDFQSSALPSELPSHKKYSQKHSILAYFLQPIFNKYLRLRFFRVLRGQNYHILHDIHSFFHLKI